MAAARRTAKIVRDATIVAPGGKVRERILFLRLSEDEWQLLNRAKPEAAQLARWARLELVKLAKRSGR